MSLLAADLDGSLQSASKHLQSIYCRMRYPKISQQYRAAAGVLPNILFPRTTGELVQWRKIFDRNPLLHTLCDKLEVKRWAKEKVAGLKVAEVLWASSDAEELPIEYVKDCFIIKTNHGCGYNYFPADYEINDINYIKQKFSEWLRIDYSATYGEWGYSKIIRKIFVERMLTTRAGTEDFKFWCHNGRVSVGYIAINEKQKNEKAGYFTVDGVPIRNRLYTLDERHPPPPCYFSAMAIARTLSVGLDYVRVDFIGSSGEPHLAEITVYPAAGYGKAHTASWLVLAGWLGEIEHSWFMSTQQPLVYELYKNRLRRHFNSLKNSTQCQIAETAPHGA